MIIFTLIGMIYLYSIKSFLKHIRFLNFFPIPLLAKASLYYHCVRFESRNRNSINIINPECQVPEIPGKRYFTIDVQDDKI